MLPYQIIGLARWDVCGLFFQCYRVCFSVSYLAGRRCNVKQLLTLFCPPIVK